MKLSGTYYHLWYYSSLPDDIASVLYGDNNFDAKVSFLIVYTSIMNHCFEKAFSTVISECDLYAAITVANFTILVML